MSDLAPFVAATLRDKVVKDQQEEINRLKRKIDQIEREKKLSRMVMVTGPEGTPVYSSGDLYSDGEDTTEDVEDRARWEVALTPTPGVACTTLGQVRVREASFWVDQRFSVPLCGGIALGKFTYSFCT